MKKEDRPAYMREYYKKYPWVKTLNKIKNRTGNPKCNRYKRYGARGIKCLISKEELKEIWFRDKAYLMKRPTIDRKNNDGHYEKSNCQYVEREVNFRNFIEHAKRTGIKNPFQSKKSTLIKV